MHGETDLAVLLATLRPALDEGDWVFCTLPDGRYGDGAELAPVATVAEDEGLTLVVAEDRARAAGLPYDGVFARIVLRVHSSLHAVGLTAAVFLYPHTRVHTTPDDLLHRPSPPPHRPRTRRHRSEPGRIHRRLRRQLRWYRRPGQLCRLMPTDAH